jgi:hypothetical protein
LGAAIYIDLFEDQTTGFIKKGDTGKLTTEFIARMLRDARF